MTYFLNESQNKVFLDRYALKDSQNESLENNIEQMWERVGNAISRGDNVLAEKFKSILYDFKFVPGGRILSGAGTGHEVTFYNCFVIPSPEDTYDGIFNNIMQMGNIMRRGGGVGIDLSTLRPNGAYVAGTGGYSSGPVAFGGVYSETTLVTSQGGSRRGALMLMLKDNHPDILEFIREKETPGRLTGANLSVKISNKFMDAVKNNKEWDLIFNGKVYRTVDAREIWEALTRSAWKSAEPGVWYSERSNEFNNLWYLPQHELIATNPCGEQPLEPWGVCNLGSINLSKFVSQDGNVKFSELRETIELAVVFLDNVVDETNYYLTQNKKSQQSIRRIGLGTMGLADMLLKMKIRYGDAKSISFVNSLYLFIANVAYQSSAFLAKDKGAFPLYNQDNFLRGKFVKNLSTETIESIRRYGIRNAYLLTQAPTGSTGLLAGVGGTGIEPIFAFQYQRTDRLGTRIIRLPIAEEIGLSKNREEWPSYVVTASDLSPREHVDIQATIQRWTDSSISKTVNMPKGTTQEEVADLYMYGYDKGLKGMTVYVDGSREGVIHYIEPNTNLVQDNGVKFSKRPRKLSATVYKQITPIGKSYVTLAESDKQIAEVFIDLGAEGSDIAAIAKGMGITATLALNPRLQSLTHKEKVEWLIKQYKKIQGSTSIGFGNDRVNSLPHAIGKVLEEHLHGDSLNDDFNQSPEIKHENINKRNTNYTMDICPECGEATFVRQDGCQTCFVCGYSKCN